MKLEKCKNMQKHAMEIMHQICKYMQKYAAQNMQYNASIWIFINMQEYAKPQLYALNDDICNPKYMQKNAIKNMQ